MENIDISKWVKSALIIDNKWDEVKDLIRVLNANGVSTSYYNPNPDHDIDLKQLGFTGFEGIDEKAKEAVEAQLQKFMNTTLKNICFDLKPDSIVGHNLIFLDIELGFEEVKDNVKYQIGKAVGILRDALKRDSLPYGVVLWSYEPESDHEGKSGESQSVYSDVVKLLYSTAMKDKPKPLFVIDLKKRRFKEPADFATLADSLNLDLQQNKMARLFAYWSKEVQQSAGLTCKDLQGYAEKIANDSSMSLEEEFFNILKYATYQHFGFSRKEEEDISDILSRYSLSYMSSQLCDKLHSHFCLKNISGIFTTHSDEIYKKISAQELQLGDMYKAMCIILKKNKLLSKDLKENLKTVVDQIISKHDLDTLHTVLSELNFRSVFDDVRTDIKNLTLSGLIYSKTISQNDVGIAESESFINITPPCDVAQGKKNARIYLSGKRYKYNVYAEAQQKFYLKEGDRHYKTPPAFDGNSYFIFSFDLRGILREIPDDADINPIFMLKSSVFSDLLQKLGHHNSRLGARTFH